MKEHPILFSTPMVQAILQGRKTVTRRVIKPQPDDDGLHNHTKFPMSLESKLEGWHGIVSETGESKEFKFHFGWEGHKLWVRETFQHTKILNINPDDENYGYVYKADDHPWKEIEGWTWKPSIFMPRAACRIILQITSIKVEHLQDITEDQAIAEGIFYNEGLKRFTSDNEGRNFHASDPRKSFMKLWIAINGEDSWDANPFVWAIGFNKL